MVPVGAERWYRRPAQAFASVQPGSWRAQVQTGWNSGLAPGRTGCDTGRNAQPTGWRKSYLDPDDRRGRATGAGASRRANGAPT
jgi:hypothetical protein